MTTPTNNVSVLEKNYLPQSPVVISSVTINEGDLVFWDGTNFTLQPLTLATQVAVGGANNSQGFMGAAAGSNNPAVYGGDPTLPCIPVLAKGCVYLLTTNGETYNHYDAVTVGADSQTIIKAGATSGNRVGFVIIDPPATSRPSQATPTPETVAGAAGVRVRVQLEPKHPVALAL
jgi:hypothetical protein